MIIRLALLQPQRVAADRTSCQGASFHPLLAWLVFFFFFLQQLNMRDARCKIAKDLLACSLLASLQILLRVVAFLFPVEMGRQTELRDGKVRLGCPCCHPPSLRLFLSLCTTFPFLGIRPDRVKKGKRAYNLPHFGFIRSDDNNTPLSILGCILFLYLFFLLLASCRFPC